MAKTTKIIRGIHSWIKFQRHQGLQSLTIKGKDSLADLSQDKNGDTDLILNADKDKINSIVSDIPFISILESIEGADPNKQRVASLNYDLTWFDAVGDEYLTVTKEPKRLVFSSAKMLEKVAEMIKGIKTSSSGFGVSTTVLGGVKYETGANTRIFDLEAHEVDMFTDNERNFLEVSLDNGKGFPITTHIVRGEKELDFDGVSIKIYKKDGKLKMKIKGSDTLGEEASLYFKLFHTGYLKGLQLAFTGGEGEDPEITVVDPTIPSVPQPLPSLPPQ